ncbi:Hypothetical predicted protein [Mytilus galloprovincialis]|uniref:Coiled-coil domain-containing protein n=1 Tax=Mytilus galloprovincialis TaxID=29158 RepID=A0A8B6GN04_MYTGA|nr:Hypothetical predicted protein [Mytilus galloprovincialis]
MERSVGSRLIGLFQQLDKIGGKAAKNPSSTDDLQQIRYVTSKIYQLLNQQEKIHRDSVLKNAAQLDLILCTLRNCSDRAVVVNIIHILLELLGKTQVGKRSSALVSANTTNILLQCMVRETEDNVTNDDLLILAHQVLAKLSSKDRKFSTKARLHRTLLITLSLIKSNICQFKNLQCLLQVFKSYTNNSVNASYLGKHNSIPPMFRVIQQCGRKHTTVLKLALEIVYNVTKSRNNAARTIGGEHVPHLLGLYQDWHQLDTKHRHVNIRKAILNILKNITNLKSGRKALADANGIQILYDTAQDVIDCREMESLILLASVIMRKCCPRNKLPCDIRSPRKQDFTERQKEVELGNIALSTAVPKQKGQQREHKVQKEKKFSTSSCSYDIMGILLDWICDAHLRYAVTDQPTRAIERFSSTEYILERVLKILPTSVDMLREFPPNNFRISLPCLQFIYWSLINVEQASGQQKSNLSSTLRRLGEELYRSKTVKFMDVSSDKSDFPLSPTKLDKSKDGIYFRSSNQHVRLLSSLIILKTLSQVDLVAHVFDVLKNDLKSDVCKELFLYYQATPVVLQYLKPINKAFMGAAMDIFLQLSADTPFQTPFLESCGNEQWFRTVAMVLRAPTQDNKLLEKLSIILQKLSKFKTNKRFFDVYTIVGIIQEILRGCSTDQAFLALNLKSILFNLTSTGGVQS